MIYLSTTRTMGPHLCLLSFTESRALNSPHRPLVPGRFMFFGRRGRRRRCVWDTLERVVKRDSRSRDFSTAIHYEDFTFRL